MKINRTVSTSGSRVLATKLSWLDDDNRQITLNFPYDVSFVHSKKNENIFVDIVEIEIIKIFNLQGQLISDVAIPKIDGLQYRGLNKSNQTKSGISLLYLPIQDNLKTIWNDVIQYELLLEGNALGKCLGICRP